MKLYFIVLGSSIATWRADFSSGNALAEGWSEPFLQNAGSSMPRTVADNQSRPFSSNMALWLFARVSQSFFSPQEAYGSSGCTLPAWPAPNASGISGSATGILKNDTWWVFGCRIVILSVAYS